MAGKAKQKSEYDILHENKDYLLVEDAIKLLKIQLAQAEKDIIKLKEYKKKALKDPINFVENLIDKKYKNIPRLQKVISIPNIDLSIYQSHSLRKPKSLLNNSNSNNLYKNDITYTENTSPNSPPNTKKRLFEEVDNKSSFYTEEWTEEETDQLLNLLEVIPEESVPMTRYVKLANCIGTKTPKQVEKKMETLAKKRKTTRKNLKPQKIAAESKIKAEKTLYSNRFSGAAYLGTPTVYMSDEEGDGTSLNNNKPISMNSAAATATVDTLSPLEYDHNQSKYHNLDILDDDSSDEDYEEPVSKPKRTNSVSYPKRTTNNSSASTYLTRSSSLPLSGTSHNKKKSALATSINLNNIHYGIQCDRCGIEPIVGIRYKCKICKNSNQVDLCEDCISKKYENGHHKANHEFKKIENYIPEDDKTTIASEDYSYLGFSRQL
ncbi:hypothetical protein BCR36DRAFT_408647 [Piromyces finnis]|uniref:ZZ-type domain-containing protein n=1 Tax=Piromyces finnis TaxID=1754191 RepID=A0A1Y1VKY2_9FUNG|nr:hypothetical protein BCR36DRAFT_408647 [Piromyces finnis]|eukprot:ORX59120.1 hypothetical protein BCR36DRAFT_408647 [Piromyces finnis]